MKRCSRCKEKKPLNCFHRNRSRKDGRSFYCRPCKNGYQRTSSVYREHPGTCSAVRSPTLEDLYWAAGFIEGEGSFMVLDPERSIGGRVEAAQVNWEPIRRLIEMFGGTVAPCYRREGPAHCLLRWRVCGTRARGVIFTLYSMLSERRRAQARKSLGVGEVEEVTDAA